MNIEERIYKLGLAALDELLLHRNISKKVDITLEDAAILSDLIVHAGPRAIFAFSEDKIAAFYRVWVKEHTGTNR